MSQVSRLPTTTLKALDLVALYAAWPSSRARVYRERYFEAIATELAGKADFYYVYILEAHPKSGWSAPGTFTADDVKHFRLFHDCDAAATRYSPCLPHVI